MHNVTFTVTSFYNEITVFLKQLKIPIPSATLASEVVKIDITNFLKSNFSQNQTLYY